MPIVRESEIAAAKMPFFIDLILGCILLYIGYKLTRKPYDEIVMLKLSSSSVNWRAWTTVGVFRARGGLLLLVGTFFLKGTS